jgi:hypothetical protein
LNNSAVPDGAPEGWTGAHVNDWGRETMARVREWYQDPEWLELNYQLASVGAKSFSRLSSTQFKVLACDASALYTAGRRVKIVGATTDYGRVSSSSYGAPDTTVTVVMDSGDVPTSPTDVRLHHSATLRGAAFKDTGSGNGLDSDKLDGYHAADLYGPGLFAEALVNGSFLVWQRGTGSTTATAGTAVFLADRWATVASGANMTVARTTTTPTGAVSPYALLVTGATSGTTCILARQRIESYLIPYIKTTVTISALVKNDTTASLTLSLLLGTPNASDDFTTVVNRLTQALTAIPSGNSQRVSFTVDISGYTNINNGLQVEFQSPSGALDAGSKTITITEIQIDRASVFSFFRFRSLPDEIMRCKRYYQKTFGYATAPAQNAGLTNSLTMTGDDALNCAFFWQHFPPMRAQPTITTYNPSTTANTPVNGTDATFGTLGTVQPGDTVTYIRFDCTGSNRETDYHIHASASAEL